MTEAQLRPRCLVQSANRDALWRKIKAASGEPQSVGCCEILPFACAQDENTGMPEIIKDIWCS